MHTLELDDIERDLLVAVLYFNKMADGPWTPQERDVIGSIWSRIMQPANERRGTMGLTRQQFDQEA